VEGVSFLWTRYIDLGNARRELGRARVRLRALRGRLAELEAVEAENRVLRSLLEIGAQRPDAEPVAARVVSAGFAVGARTLAIDRGAVHGVERGQAVVSPSGLVGLVQRAGWTSSEVVLLVDPRLTVLARVARTRVSGRVRGAETGQDLVMEDVSRDGDVETGDLVVTSGQGAVFPPNIPIGRVGAVSTDGRRRRLELDAAADFERLDWLSVLPATSPDRPGPTPPLLRPPSLWPRLDVPEDASWSRR